MKHWKVIDDSSVRYIWVCSDEDCSIVQNEMIVSPEDYAEIGVPICSECGNDLEYVRTEIYQTKESITPIKRKKSYPDWSSMFDVGNKVEVLADKTDIFNDFVGTVYGFKSRGIVSVRDYDDNVFDCWESQLELVES